MSLNYCKLKAKINLRYIKIIFVSLFLSFSQASLAGGGIFDSILSAAKAYTGSQSFLSFTPTFNIQQSVPSLGLEGLSLDRLFSGESIGNRLSNSVSRINPTYQYEDIDINTLLPLRLQGEGFNFNTTVPIAA